MSATAAAARPDVPLKEVMPLATPPKEIQPFAMNSMALLEFSNANWRISAHAGVGPQDLGNPVLWSVTASRLRAFDLVHVIGHAGRWWAEVLVASAQMGMATKVKVLRHVELEANIPNDRMLPPNHEIEFDAVHSQFTAYRKEADGSRVKIGSQYSTWAECYSNLLEHASLRSR